MPWKCFNIIWRRIKRNRFFLTRGVYIGAGDDDDDDDDGDADGAGDDDDDGDGDDADVDDGDADDDEDGGRTEDGRGMPRQRGHGSPEGLRSEKDAVSIGKCTKQITKPPA